MKGQEKPLMELFNTNSREFYIPLYQRNYSWQQSQCSRLFEDVLDIKRKNRRSYFIGSIVSKLANETGDALMIIDGQQRITTISLLLLALLDAYNSDDIVSIRPQQTPGKIKDTWIMAMYSSKGKSSPKLNPLREDKQAYEQLMKDPNLAPKDSLMTTNYFFFRNKIKEVANRGYTLENLHDDCISKLQIVHISIEKDDDAQLIFESLNSTGLDLTAADKIRNFLFMDISLEEQEYLYDNYWNPIEQYTHKDASDLIRDFITSRTSKFTRQSQLYEEFKTYFYSYGLNSRDLLKLLKHYAELYDKINRNQIGTSDKLNTLQKQWNSLDSTVSMPYLLAFYNYAREQSIPEEQQCEMLLILQNYYARRVICNLPSNTLTKIFATLHSDILRLMSASGQPYQYNEVLKHVLLRKQGKAAFPSDEEVSDMFHRVRAYRLPRQNRNFFLERLENMHDPHKRHPMLLEQLDRGDVTIEHIMPQKLSAAWQKDLGDDYERIHDRWIDTFANLTLTGDNSSYSNRSFQEKKNGYIDAKGQKIEGLAYSPYRTAKMLGDYANWSEQELESRSESLLERFFELWPHLTTTYQAPTKDNDTISFDEDHYNNHILTGRKIIAYTLDGDRKETSTWKSMYQEVILWMYDHYPSVLERIAYDFSGLFRKDLLGVSEKDYLKLSDTCYVKTSTSNYDKYQVICLLLEKTGEDGSILEVEME